MYFDLAGADPRLYALGVSSTPEDKVSSVLTSVLLCLDLDVDLAFCLVLLAVFSSQLGVWSGWRCSKSNFFSFLRVRPRLKVDDLEYSDFVPLRTSGISSCSVGLLGNTLYPRFAQGVNKISCSCSAVRLMIWRSFLFFR